MNRPINEIVVHCAATPEGSWFTAADIDRWHKRRGWTGIGYHNVILLNGAVEDGRAEEIAGAHVAGHNRSSLGVCYIGGVDKRNKPKDTRTDAQRQSLLDVVHAWMEKYGLGADAVHGHYELDPRKACPSFDMDKFRAELVWLDTVATGHAELGKEDRPGDDYNAELPTLRPPYPNGSALMLLTRYLPGIHRCAESGIESCVRAFQQATGLEVDGIVGPRTWASLLRDI